MVHVDCPVEGCDYSGPIDSVEGHLSASTAGDHKGRLGIYHRGELVAQAERRLNNDPENGSVVKRAREAFNRLALAGGARE